MGFYIRKLYIKDEHMNRLAAFDWYFCVKEESRMIN